MMTRTGAIAEEIPPIGEPADFDEFYRREVRAVVGLAYALSGSRLAAEDLAQEAFLAAHRRWPDLCTYDRPGAWVRRVVANMATSRTRRWLAEGRAMARLGPDRRVALPDLPAEADATWTAVRALPRRQRQVVALHYVDDRSVEDVAAILGLAEGTVKAHLARGQEQWLPARLAWRLNRQTGKIETLPPAGVECHVIGNPD